jgi:outer membrane protein OmpA-like peptidoglycan-associated protein
MRALLTIALTALLFVAGCGVNKKYVSEQIALSEAKSGAQVQAVQDKTDANAAELARLQQLALQLGEKTDMAINKASGFEKYQVIWTGEIRFPFDSYEIDGMAASILDEAGAKMEQVPYALIEIVGHTDKTGAASYNLVLGEKRSNAARRYLADKFGISLYRMFINSYGEEKPIELPDQKNASSKNRRVVLTIWGLPQ